MSQPAVYAKSIVSGLIAAVSFAIPCVDDGLVASEVLGILLAGLTGLGITYAVPNRDPLGAHQDESVQPRERGAVDVVTVAAILVAVVCVIYLVTRFG